MGDKTGIEWCDATWNPVVGCSITSPGCAHCYAMGVAHRLGSNPKLPHYHGLTELVNGHPVWTGKLALAPESVRLAPLRWARPRRIFVNSMGDLFHEDMPLDWIDATFMTMLLAPQHSFISLTKRPERQRAYLADPATPVRLAEREGASVAAVMRNWPLANFWAGTSIEDQTRANERLPVLLDTPAAVRLVSAEPLIGPVNLLGAVGGDGMWLSGLHWVIAGGESGPGARPMHPAWARALQRQCERAKIAFFFKQWGNWAWAKPEMSEVPTDWRDHPLRYLCLDLIGKRTSGLGGLGEEFMINTGKRDAGHMLDGREWHEFPGADGAIAGSSSPAW